jgi:hypothetical protein
MKEVSNLLLILYEHFHPESYLDIEINIPIIELDYNELVIKLC